MRRLRYQSGSGSFFVGRSDLLQLWFRILDVRIGTYCCSSQGMRWAESATTQYRGSVRTRENLPQPKSCSALRIELVNGAIQSIPTQTYTPRFAVSTRTQRARTSRIA